MLKSLISSCDDKETGEKFILILFFLSKVMSNSILQSFVWKLLGIRDIELRDCKYLKKNGRNFSNKNILKAPKFQSLVFIVFNIFELLKILQSHVQK